MKYRCPVDDLRSIIVGTTLAIMCPCIAATVEYEMTLAPEDGAQSLVAGSSMPFRFMLTNRTDKEVTISGSGDSSGSIVLFIRENSGLEVPFIMEFGERGSTSIDPNTSYTQLLYLGKYLSPYSNEKVTLSWKSNLGQRATEADGVRVSGSIAISILPRSAAFYHREITGIESQLSLFNTTVPFEPGRMLDLVDRLVSMDGPESDQLIGEILKSENGPNMYGTDLVDRLSERWESAEARDLLTKQLENKSVIVLQWTLRAFVNHGVIPPVDSLRKLFKSDDETTAWHAVTFLEKIIAKAPYSYMSTEELSQRMPLAEITALSSRPDTELGARCNALLEANADSRKRVLPSRTSREMSKDGRLLDPRKTLPPNF